MLEIEWSRKRQERLLKQMEREKLDAAIVGAGRHIHYLSAFYTHWLQQSALILFTDGRSTLISANQPATATAADRCIAYEAQWNSTQRDQQPAVVAAAIREELRGRNVANVGIDASAVTSMLIEEDLKKTSLEPFLYQCRRRKDPDELALMARAIDCTAVMYKRAGEIIDPGVLETKVFSELHAAAVEAAGEPLAAFLGNDYRSGARGGPARGGRQAAAGEIYILDLGPCYRGYFADNARSFAVDRKPTDEQQKAWRDVTAVFPIVERMAKPGAKCRAIWDAVNEHYRNAWGEGLSHHLGHGVGLEPHEFPHLNPKWDDTLQEGEIFTAEPGIYSENLRAGIRIENQYLVTATGVKNLTPWPLDLV